RTDGGRATEVVVRDLQTSRTYALAADYVISTMPVCDLVAGFDPPAPEDVRRIAAGLPYRAFITVGLLLHKMKGWRAGSHFPPAKVWLGLEYFCSQDDDLWALSDTDMRALATTQLEKIDLIDAADVIDATVIRVPKAYPAYFGSYSEFGRVRAHVDSIANIFLV